MKSIRLFLFLALTAISVQTASAFYDPSLGRWISRDPIGEEGGINLYSYVGSDPMNKIDPDGLSAMLIVRQNGGSQLYEFPTIKKLKAELTDAAKTGNLIDQLYIKGHANPEDIHINGGWIFGEKLTTGEGGQIITSDGEDITDLLKQGLTPNALIALNGCRTGRGKDNISQRLSKSLPNRVVIGGAAPAQFSIPFTVYSVGKRNVYINGTISHTFIK